MVPAAKVTVISCRRLTKAISCCEIHELVDHGTQTRPIPPPTRSAECDPVLSGAACWKLWKGLGRLGLPLPLPAELSSAGSRVAEMSPAPAARATTTTTTQAQHHGPNRVHQTRQPQPTARSTARLADPPSRNARLGKGPDNPGIWSGVASRRSHVASTTTSGTGRRRSPENPWEWDCGPQSCCSGPGG